MAYSRFMARSTLLLYAAAIHASGPCVWNERTQSHATRHSYRSHYSYPGVSDSWPQATCTNPPISYPHILGTGGAYMSTCSNMLTRRTRRHSNLQPTKWLDLPSTLARPVISIQLP